MKPTREHAFKGALGMVVVIAALLALVAIGLWWTYGYDYVVIEPAPAQTMELEPVAEENDSMAETEGVQESNLEVDELYVKQPIPE